MASEWKELERKVNYNGVNKPNILIIEVHADAIKSINSECAQHVYGYPTIMSVKKGGLFGQEHNGERDAETMLQFMKLTIPTASRQGSVGSLRPRSTKKRDTTIHRKKKYTNRRKKPTRRKRAKKSLM